MVAGAGLSRGAHEVDEGLLRDAARSILPLVPAANRTPFSRPPPPLRPPPRPVGPGSGRNVSRDEDEVDGCLLADFEACEGRGVRTRLMRDMKCI